MTGPPEAADGAEVFECYCGLGAECPMYGQMTASQRADCSCDKRLTAQWMYINGMTR